MSRFQYVNVTLIAYISLALNEYFTSTSHMYLESTQFTALLLFPVLIVVLGMIWFFHQEMKRCNKYWEVSQS